MIYAGQSTASISENGLSHDFLEIPQIEGHPLGSFNGAPSWQPMTSLPAKLTFALSLQARSSITCSLQ